MFRPPKVIKEIWLFIKRHMVICILCLFCGFIIAKNTSIPVPSWLPTPFAILLECPQKETTSAELFEILNNLSLAFIASIIAYILIQYIPERKKAYKAFAILKDIIRRVNEDVSYLISIYMFEVGIDRIENKISLKRLKKLSEIEISDHEKCVEIHTIINGEKGNSIQFGYNLFKDSFRYVDAIKKNIAEIKEAMCSSQLDAEIIKAISIIENNFLIRCFYKNSNITRFIKNGYSHRIFHLDKGMYELIKAYLIINKYNIERISFNIVKISDEQMEIEKEEMLFMTSRVLFSLLGEKKVEEVVEQIIALPPTPERMEKGTIVLLEILTSYDSEIGDSSAVLQEALKLAEYIKENDTDDNNKVYELLNVLQVKKRQNSLSYEDSEKLLSIIEDENMPRDIILGASIIFGDYEKASQIFEKLSDEEIKQFIRLPIYHLWSHPPIEYQVKKIFT